MKTSRFPVRQSYMYCILGVLFAVFTVLTRVVFEKGTQLEADWFAENAGPIVFHFVFSFCFSLFGFFSWKIVYGDRKSRVVRYLGVTGAFILINELFFFGNNLLIGQGYGHGTFEFIFYLLHFCTYITIWVFGSFFLAFQKNFEVSLENEQLKREQLKNQLEALRNQLNPHFLFNALNILNISIISDPETAQKIVYALSDILRYNLKVQNQSLSPLDDEIEAARSYLDLYKARYGDKLVFYFLDIKPSKEWYVIPLSLQILIENAIKHNVITSNRVLLIEIRLDEPMRQLMVINSINRKKNVVSTGVGLQNLDKRYRLQVGSRPVLHVDEEQFIVKVPLIEGP